MDEEHGWLDCEAVHLGFHQLQPHPGVKIMRSTVLEGSPKCGSVLALKVDALVLRLEQRASCTSYFDFDSIGNRYHELRGSRAWTVRARHQGLAQLVLEGQCAFTNGRPWLDIENVVDDLLAVSRGVECDSKHWSPVTGGTFWPREPKCNVYAETAGLSVHGIGSQAPNQQYRFLVC